MVLKGLERRADQGGRRWAKGEVRLKFVVNVNVARLVRTPFWILLAIHPRNRNGNRNTAGEEEEVP